MPGGIDVVTVGDAFVAVPGGIDVVTVDDAVVVVAPGAACTAAWTASRLEIRLLEVECVPGGSRGFIWELRRDGGGIGRPTVTTAGTIFSFHFTIFFNGLFFFFL